MQIDQLFGGSGDDRIWMVNPNQISQDIFVDKIRNYGFGGIGNDYLYGTDSKDVLWGDDRDPNSSNGTGPGNLDVEDTVGGNDFLRGYGQDDKIHGGYGNDILYGDEGKDLLYGEFGDDKIFGGDDNDTIWGDDKAGPANS